MYGVQSLGLIVAFGYGVYWGYSKLYPDTTGASDGALEGNGSQSVSTEETGHAEPTRDMLIPLEKTEPFSQTGSRALNIWIF